MIVSLKCAFPSASFPRLRPRISLLASSLLSSSSWSIHKNLLFKTFKKSSKKQIENEWKRITDDNRTQGKHLCRYWIGSSWCWIASFCFHGAKTSVHKLRDYTPNVFNKKNGSLVRHHSCGRQSEQENRPVVSGLKTNQFSWIFNYFHERTAKWALCHSQTSSLPLSLDSSWSKPSRNPEVTNYSV